MLEESMDRQTMDEDYPALVAALVCSQFFNVVLGLMTALEQTKVNDVAETVKLAGALVSDGLASIIEGIWADEDKNKAIGQLRAKLVRWDQAQRKHTQHAAAAAAGPPKLTRTIKPVPPPASKNVGFATVATPSFSNHSQPKGKQRALSTFEDSEEDDSPPPPAKVRVAAAKDKRKRVLSDSEEEPAAPPPPVSAGPPKKKRIISQAFVEASEDEVDELTEDPGVAGVNPHPCTTCVERKKVCEWLLDTTKKACRVCARLKSKCNTLDENKLALEDHRRLLSAEQRRTGLFNPDMSQVAEFMAPPKTVVKVTPRVRPAAPAAPVSHAPSAQAAPAPPPPVATIRQKRPKVSATVVAGESRAAAATAGSAMTMVQAKSKEWEERFRGKSIYFSSLTTDS
jgi:hypothetical protein